MDDVRDLVVDHGALELLRRRDVAMHHVHASQLILGHDQVHSMRMGGDVVRPHLDPFRDEAAHGPRADAAKGSRHQKSFGAGHAFTRNGSSRCFANRSSWLRSAVIVCRKSSSTPTSIRSWILRCTSSIVPVKYTASM